MYLNYNDMNLTVTRGDSIAFGFEIQNMEGDLTNAFFSVKENKDSVGILFQKSFGDGITKINSTTYRVRVAPEDTIDLELGNYYYDLVVNANGDIYTLLKGVMTIEFDVTPHTQAINETPVLSGLYSVSVVDETLILTREV